MVGEREELAVNFEGQGGKCWIKFVIQRDMLDVWMDHGSEGRPGIEAAGLAKAEMGKNELEGSGCLSHSQWSPGRSSVSSCPPSSDQRVCSRGLALLSQSPSPTYESK